MKLKSAMKGFCDAVANPARRLDVLSFLRRYSDRTRVLTHYACRGEATKAVVSFLKSLGFEEETDYTVLSSSFDPESNSIRWTSATGKMADLVADLGDLPKGTLDRLAAGVCGTSDELSSDFSDREAGVAEPVRSTFDDHFLVKAKCRSDWLIEGLLANGKDGSDLGPNGKTAVALAKEWAKRMKDSPERPFILPLPILEACYRLMNPSVEGVFMFREDGMSAQACRVCRGTEENIPGRALFEAPLPEILGGNDNPLAGYLYSTVKTLEAADLSDKDLCIAYCNAPIFFAEGEDIVTPALKACQAKDLWRYVKDIYDGCYPDSCHGFLGNIRVAVSDRSKTWHPDIGGPSGAIYGNNALRTPDGEHMVAMYAVMFGKNPLSYEYESIDDIVSQYNTVKVVKGDPETDRPDYSEAGLTVEETAWEWFAMTHGTPYNKTVHTYAYGRKQGDTHSTENNFRSFRRWKKQAGSKVLSSLSRAGSELFDPKEGDGYRDMQYTPVSAFVSGSVPLSFRIAKDTATLPIVPWGGEDRSDHPSDVVVVSNVYSGIWTDLSPEIGADGDVFPKMRGYEFEQVLSASDESRKAVTKWLASMAKDGTKQVRFAQRTKGTPRNASLVVETNLNAAELFSDLGIVGDLRRRLGTAFIQNMLLRKNDPYVSTDEFMQDATNSPTDYRAADYSDKMFECIGNAWLEGAFQDASYRRLPSSTYDPVFWNGMLSVTTLVDSYGRLVLVFTVTGDALQYARYAHRFHTEMPLATAYTRSKTYVSNGRDVILLPGDESNFEKLVVVMRNQHATYRSEDYSGSSSHVPYGGQLGPMHRQPFATIAPGQVPTREWLTSLGTMRASDILER